MWRRAGQQPAGAAGSAAAEETVGAAGAGGGAKESPAGVAPVVVSDTPPPELPTAPPREADELVGQVDEPSASQSLGRPPVAVVRRLSDVEVVEVVDVDESVVTAGALSARAARRNAQVRRDRQRASLACLWRLAATGPPHMYRNSVLCAT